LLTNLKAVTQNLSEFPTQFDEQTNKLNGLGARSAELTGASYESCVPTGCEDIDLTVPEPTRGIEPEIRVEPFGPMSPEPTSTTGATGVPPGIFQPAVDDSLTDPALQPETEESAPDQQAVRTEGSSDDAMPDSPLPEQPILSSQEDRVYDLAEFDAVALEDDDAAVAAEADRIYDLEELGAVALQ
jgi:hypothetical protein